MSCSKLPDRPRDSGTCTLPPPNTAGGDYEVRMFRSNGYTRLARSRVSTSGTSSAADVSVTVSPMVAPAGAVVNVQWRGIDSPSPTDWIGLFRSGDADTGFLVWQYVGCADVPLDARSLGSCNVLLPRDLTLGSYEFRLFSANGYTRLALSRTLQVQ